MVPIRFTKMHGCGNDYIYVNCFETRPDDPGELAKTLSKRRHSIGADGLILVCPSEIADGRMEMYNADGSRGRMCGNGIRCVAKFLYDKGLARKEEMAIETDSGVKYVAVKAENGQAVSATVNMGTPILHDNPLSGEQELTAVCMGNPHAVLFVEDVHTAPVHTLGPVIEKDSRFPEGVNVEFVHVVNRQELDFRVWERGSGETLACGTGACAAVVAAVTKGLTERQVTVHLPGGDLEIDWREDGVYMTGEAITVYEGETV